MVENCSQQEELGTQARALPEHGRVEVKASWDFFSEVSANCLTAMQEGCRRGYIFCT